MTAALDTQGVQYGTITVASSYTTGTASINAMGAGGFLLMLGLTASQAGASYAQSSCGLTISGGTVTATRQTGGSNTVTVPFVAVDGDTTNLIQSVNHGTVSFNGGQSNGTFAVSAVTTANTAVAHLGMRGTSTSVSLNLSWPIWSVSSTTAIRMDCNTSGGTLTGYACAIEFKSSALQSLQYVSNTASPATTTRNSTISAVTLANTFQVYAGMWSSSTNINSARQYGELTSTTNLRITTGTAGFISINYSTFVVELVSALVETGCQRGLISLSSSTSNTATISAVTVADAITTWCGNSTGGTQWANIITRITLTNTTTVTVNSNSKQTGGTPYEVIALNPAAGGDVNANPTTVAGTATLGTLTVQIDVSVTLTGVAASAAVGDPTVSLLTPVPITGEAATGQVGTPTVTGDSNTTPTGVAATGQVGTPVAQGASNVTLDGVAANALPGDVTVDVFTQADPPGVAAAGQVGTPTVDVSVSITPTGVAGTAQPGDVTVSLLTPVPIIGVEAEADPGNVTVTADSNVTLTGVAGAAQPGDVTVVAGTVAEPPGVSANALPGDPTVTGASNVTLDGVAAAGQVNTPTVDVSVSISVTGVQAAGQAGDLTVDLTTFVNIEGVEATTQLGVLIADDGTGGGDGTYKMLLTALKHIAYPS